MEEQGNKVSHRGRLVSRVKVEEEEEEGNGDNTADLISSS